MTGRPVVIATDLDQTLIFSPTAAARGEHRPSRVVEVLDGTTISLMSEQTRLGLVDVAERATLVPTTTRTQAQYARIDLPMTSRHAIVASGAVILLDGQPDAEWTAQVARRLAQDSAPVTELREVLQGYADREWLLRLRDADDVFLVAAVDAGLLGVDELASVSTSCGALGWRTVHQGRKLYLLPNGLDKAAAVQRVMELVTLDQGRGEPLLLAAGDTGLDRGMLELASHGWFPAGSELDRLGYAAPGVTRTRGQGLSASEQIVQAWLERVGQGQLTDAGR